MIHDKLIKQKKKDLLKASKQVKNLIPDTQEAKLKFGMLQDHLKEDLKDDR